MARQKTKPCLYCYSSFRGRRDAKTCSARCRKGLQRARVLLERDYQTKLAGRQSSPLIIDRYTSDDRPLSSAGLVRGIAQ
jgi:hypothetical protein